MEESGLDEIIWKVATASLTHHPPLAFSMITVP